MNQGEITRLLRENTELARAGHSSMGQPLQIKGVEVSDVIFGLEPDRPDDRTTGNLSLADFETVTFRNVQFRNLASDKRCRFAACRFENCEFHELNLPNCQLDGCVFRNCKFFGFFASGGRSKGNVEMLGCYHENLALHDFVWNAAVGGRLVIEGLGRLPAQTATLSLSHCQWDSGTLGPLHTDCLEINDTTASEIVYKGVSVTRITIAKNARLNKVSVVGCELGNLAGTAFTSIVDCDFRGVALWSAQLLGARLERTRFDQCDFRNAVLDKGRVRGASFSGAKGLFGPDMASQKDIHDSEFATFGSGHLVSKHKWIAWLVDFANWDRIRTLASLSFFSASTITVTLIVAYGTAARWYNSFLERLVASVNDKEWASQMVSHLPPRLTIPKGFQALLIATFALVVGGIVLRMFCPSIVKEYSGVRWIRELGSPRVEYESASHSRPILRMVSFLCLAGGGGFISLYILVRAVSILLGEWGIL